MTENLPSLKIWGAKEEALIKATCAPKCNDEEFGLMMYLARTYGLDPLARQIWAVKYQDNQPARIFVGRDGYLVYANRNPQYDGMETKIEGSGDERTATSTVWRKDHAHPTTVSVSMKEYNKKQGNWLTMPDTMLKKVSQSQALRMAFDITGVYAPEEFAEQEKPPMRDITPEPEKKKGGRVPVHDLSKEKGIIDAEAEQKK